MVSSVGCSDMRICLTLNLNRANRAQFTEVSLQTIDEDEHLRAQDTVLPTLQAQEDDADLPDALEDANGSSTGHALQDDGAQLSSDLVTLSLLPRSKWQTLINLEAITARNKPKEPPKAPEQAPFFLPTLPGTETRFDLAEAGGVGAKNGNDPKRKLGFAEMEVESDMVRRLRGSTESGDRTWSRTGIGAKADSLIQLTISSRSSSPCRPLPWTSRSAPSPAQTTLSFS